jgi:hypothetical protein
VPRDKPIPSGRDEKLKRILEHLEKHQDLVRRNMIYLATLQKEKLLSDARDAMERERAKEDSSHAEVGDVSSDPELEQDIKELLESLNEPAVRGTSGKEYEYEDGDFDTPLKDAARAVIDGEGDAAMGGMDNATSRKRNIHLELNNAIRDLVTRTASQIEMYDQHAEQTKGYYQRALDRHNIREGIVTGITAAPTNVAPAALAQERRPGGILRHTSSEIRVNTEALARMEKEEQTSSSNQQAQSAIDVLRDPRKTAVDYSRDPRRRHSVQFAHDSKKSSMDGSKDVWRR